MRRITKTHPPQEFLDWLRDNADLDCSYTALKGKEAHIKLKEHLIQEQGSLCAYTGRVIEKESSHVEHIKPQNLCDGTEDVDYRNMLACFPCGGGDTSYGYGAPVKGGSWDEDKFISPCDENCDRKFKFTWKGAIKPSSEGDESANYTIQLLMLDHKALEDMRFGAIKGFFGFSRQSKDLSKDEAAKLLPIIDKASGQGKLRPFCFVLKQLLVKYLGT